jgi:hypothetical protein
MEGNDHAITEKAAELRDHTDGKREHSWCPAYKESCCRWSARGLRFPLVNNFNSLQISDALVDDESE